MRIESAPSRPAYLPRVRGAVACSRRGVRLRDVVAAMMVRPTRVRAMPVAARSSRGDDAQLLHEAQLIHAEPVLGDSSIAHSHEVDVLECDGLSGGGDLAQV